MNDSTLPGGFIWHRLIPLLAAVSLLTSASNCHAEDQRTLQFSGSGFMTLAAGSLFRGSAADPAVASPYTIPYFVNDYGQGSVYQTGRWDATPDSKLGLQGEAKIDKQLSFTGQVVSRGSQNGKVDLEWLYGSYKLNDKVILQVGRKRLPLFYYSESQDVGLSFPWVRLPPQLYGWETVNYNGANVLYQDKWADWTSKLNVFVGSETRKNNPYWKIYSGKNSETDTRWSNLWGGELSISPRDWLDTRVVYIQSDTQNRPVTDNNGVASAVDYSAKALQKLYGFSVSADHENWVGRAEFLITDRKHDYGGDHAQLLGVGYHIGKYLPMLTYANYRQILKSDSPSVVDGTYPPGGQESHDTLSLLLRYDLGISSALKIQLDHWRSKVGPLYALPLGTNPPYGNSNLLSASYDVVF